MAGIIPIAPDYSDKDFDSVRVRLQNIIKSVFPDWTDFNRANFGNILLDSFAFVFDILSFYQDSQSAESRIGSATQRESLLSLVKLIGYRPATATAAQATVAITIPAAVAGDCVFPAGTIVMTEEITDPIEYQLLSTLTIPSGQTSVSGTAENSETRSDVFTSNGLANQTFPLTATPYIDASAIVSAGNGAYTEVADFLSSSVSNSNGGRDFTISVDQNDRATIRFGNGVNGTIPVGSIAVTYKTGGGQAGRVDAGKLKKLQGSFTSTTGVAIAPTVTNPAASAGGNDRATIAQIKELAPATLRTLTRSVTKEDFETNAKRVSGVARALMLTSNEDPAVGENTGILFVVPTGGGAPTQTIKDAVLQMVTVTYPHTLTFQVTVQDPSYKTVNVAATIYLKNSATSATVKAAITSSLTKFFQPQNDDGSTNDNIDFGGNVKDIDGEVVSELSLSDIYNIIRDTTGVRKIDPSPGGFTLNGSFDDVLLEPREFPKLGTISLVNGDTGQPM